MTVLHSGRARATGLLLVLCAVLGAGCVDKGQLRRDILAGRHQRFQQWRAETAGQDAERPLLSGELTMDACVAFALEHSRSVQMIAEEQNKAEARIREAWAEAWPQIALSTGYAYLDEAPARTGTRNTFDTRLTLEQSLWRGGMISAGIRAATIYSALIEERVRGTRQDVIYEVRKAYLDGRLAYELEESARQSVEVADRALNDARKDRAAGAAADFDVLRAEVQLKNFKAAYHQARNRHHLAVTALLNVMNASQASRVTLKDPLAHRPMQPEMAEAVEAAYAQNPSLLEQEYNLRVQQELVTIERAGYYPRLDATITWDYATPDPHQPVFRDSGTAWTAGVALTYKLFEGFRTSALVKQAEAELRKNKVQLLATEERILLEIRQAIVTLNDATLFIESQQANVEQAAEALRLIQLGRAQGTRREIEELDAQRALDEARANMSQSVYSHEIAALNLARAMGALDGPASAAPSSQP